MPTSETYHICFFEPGLHFLFMTGLERNGDGGLLACWHCDEGEALSFPSRETALEYMMPMVREKHSSLKGTRICRMTPDADLGESINHQVSYTRAMKVLE